MSLKAVLYTVQLVILLREISSFLPNKNIGRSITKDSHWKQIINGAETFRNIHGNDAKREIFQHSRLSVSSNKVPTEPKRKNRDQEIGDGMEQLMNQGLDLSHLDLDVGAKYAKSVRRGSTADFDFDEPHDIEGAWPRSTPKAKAKKKAKPAKSSTTNKGKKFSNPRLAGINKKILDLSLDDLEKRMEGKFKKILAEDEDFYDEDDEGYENSSMDLEEPEMNTESSFKLRPVQEPLPKKQKEKNAAVSDQKVKEKKVKKKDTIPPTKVEATAEKKEKVKKEKIVPKPLDPATIDSSRIISLEGLGRTGDWEGIPSFEECGIKDTVILENLLSMGITTPTSVQANAIKTALSGSDVVIKAYTGSGKTLAFLLPLLISINVEENHIQAVVVAPSRELGAQIHNVMSQVTEGTGIRTQSLIGGANVIRQIDAMKKKKPQIVVGTPGRLAELAFKSKRLRLGMVRHIVLDEVDMLLKPVFRSEVEQLIEGMGSRKQVMFASATGDSQVVRKAMDQLMQDGKLVGGRSTGNSRAEVLPSNLAHTYVVLPESKRLETLRRFMHTQPFPESAIVFVNDQRKVNILVEKLYDMGIIAAPLHGESSKDDRREVLKRLLDGRLAMVVSTELAARGLDIPQLSHVINYDLPTDGEHYVHRAGRCGRAGNPGIVVSFSTPKTIFVLQKFSRQLGVPFQEIEIKHTKLLLKGGDKKD